jgi:hypothetical protein
MRRGRAQGVEDDRAVACSRHALGQHFSSSSVASKLMTGSVHEKLPFYIHFVQAEILLLAATWVRDRSTDDIV